MAAELRKAVVRGSVYAAARRAEQVRELADCCIVDGVVPH
jgi:hypothetical protein